MADEVDKLDRGKSPVTNGVREFWSFGMETGYT